MSSERLRDAAQKIRVTVARHAAAKRGDSQDYEWMEAREALMLLGFTSEPVALAVADWLDGVTMQGYGPEAVAVADAILGPVPAPA
jgi:hypothetical protein